MCGIAGIFHIETAKPVDPKRVQTMTDSLAHRGPDGSGIWTAPGVGLGHRRLSIIDIEGSPQPMHSADERFTISFNGEIYNFLELRAQLEQLGHEFRTSGDTEVIIAAWQQWGEDAVALLHGMFVFAIYDAKLRQLWLVRDRLGVKPLYYAALADGSVIFGSELKALLAHPGLRKIPDKQAVDDYMAFGYVPDHRCLVAGVKKLPAGSIFPLVLGKPLSTPQQYWDIDFSRRIKGSQAELEEELVRLLQQAVTSRMISDVPLGAFLSGGVDSSSVVAMMAEHSRGPVTTCSIGFDAKGLDESDYAERIAKRFATNHYSRIVDPDDMDLIDRLAGFFDEPFADASALPTYRVAELAREHVTVALSGDGADEALAGYRRQVFHAHEEKIRGFIPASVRSSILEPLGQIYPKADWAPRFLRAKTTLLSLARSGAAGYAEAVGINPPALRQSFYSDDFRRQLDGYHGETYMMALMKNAPARSGLDQAQYADMKMWLPGDILTKADRMSMAVSLEAREPLLDHRLVEFAAQLPDKMRVRGNQGKWLMKKSMERYLPEDILYRPKMGFVTPISQWFRGPMAEQARSLSKNAMLAQTGWFDAQAITDVAEDHIAGKAEYGRLLWQFVMLEKSLSRIFA